MSWLRSVVAIGLLSGSVGQATAARGPSYAALLAKARAASSHAARSGKQAVAVAGPERAYEPTQDDRERGLVVYVPGIEKPFAGLRPGADELPDAVRVRAAGGQTESFLLAVYALKSQRGLSVAIRGAVPDGVQVEVLPVVMAPVGQRRSQRYRMVGMWLAEAGPVDIAAGRSAAWLVRMHIGRDVRPGDYRLGVAVRLAGGELVETGPRIRLRVLPIKLVDAWQRGYVFGAFCAGADFSEAQYRQMKRHGIEAILWFWGHYGLNVVNEDGKLRMDFGDLDRTVGRFRRAGLRGPIVLALGNDRCGHFERAICEAFDLPMQPRVKRAGKVVKLAVLDEPRIEELIVEALRQLFEHARSHDWPEIVILPYDEPTERLMKEHRRMVRLLREHFPRVRLYGVTMDRLEWAKMLLDTDILVANGDFARIRKLARERDKSTWFYGSVTAGQGYAACRWRYGLRHYAYRPDGAWFWSYNFYVGDPWNEFDGHTPDSAWVICWPPLEPGAGSVETLGCEGLREAVDDVRYAMTLEDRLARASGPVAEKIRSAYERWLAGLQGASPSAEQVMGLRDQLIEWLLELQPVVQSGRPAR